MTKLCATIGLIFVFCLSVFPQSENYSIPPKWELYSVTDKKVSFLMPRLPILVEGGDGCRGENTLTYAAYTDGVAYTVRITSKIKLPDYCLVKKKFDEKNFIEKVNELKQNLTDEGNSANNISKDSVIKLTGKDRIVKLINDYENKRWFELAAYGADEKKADVSNFLASLKNDDQTKGIAIGQGAEQVYGDPVTATEVQVKNDKGEIETVKRLLIKTDNKETKGATIILKPKARYTDAARQANIQGKVVLRVSFLANGAIGSISVISGLRSGLTDEAIKAARKIVFLPPQRDGVRYSVTKPVEYSFTIY